MKMIFAIMHKDDAMLVSTSLTKEGFHVTKLASTGGFLMAGNTTFILVTEDAKVDAAIKIIAQYSSKRMQAVQHDITGSMGGAMGVNFPIQVQIGGATIFVLNVERYEQL